MEPTSPSSLRISSHTNPTSSISSQSRRQKQDSSGESAATNVDIRDIYRQGFPAPLRPLPLQHFIVKADDERIQSWEPAQDAAIRYLQARHIEWKSMSVINRRDPREQASQDDLTILITADRDITSDSWYLMLQDLHTYLQENDLPPVRVEILDPRYSRAPAHAIVELSHPLVSVWPNLSDRIIEALHSKPWLTLTAIRRGTHVNLETNPITILITTPEPSSLDSTRESILSICADAGFYLPLEILKERNVFAMDNPAEVAPSLDAFVNPISMGSSMSVKSVENSSGTMGGTIFLDTNNSRVQVGVTNFHVMRTQDISEHSVDTGLGPDECSNMNTRAVVPSNQDTRFLLVSLQNQLDNKIEPQLAKLKEKWEMFGEERDANNFQKLKDQQQRLRQQIDMIRIFNRDAGSLYAYSGFRVHPQSKFGLDWALVKLPNHRSMQNLLPTQKEIQALGTGVGVGYNPPDSLKLEEWSVERVRGEEVVYKRGRTTNLTVGKFSSIEPRVHLGDKICSAWQVVGMRRKLFSELGDSGSFILDDDGKWCGLLFVAPYTDGNCDAYVLPVDELIADIESLTGANVSLL